jgi:hypothetical protein
MEAGESVAIVKMLPVANTNVANWELELATLATLATIPSASSSSYRAAMASTSRRAPLGMATTWTQERRRQGAEGT